MPPFGTFRLLLPKRDRSRQRVTRREALLYHLVQAPLVDRVGKELDQLGTKSRQIFWLPTREELLIDLYLLVHPCPTGIPDVSLQARPRRYRAPAQRIGLDQKPGSVANRGHRLFPPP